MFQKRKYILAGIFIIAFFLFFNLAKATGVERNSISKTEKGIGFFKAPFQTGATFVTQKIKDFFGLFEEVDSLRKQNAALKEKISEMNNEIYALKDDKLENIRLRNLLNYKDSHSEDFDLLVAKVIGRSPSNWYKTITINLGSNDGISKNMPVITPDGLVGRVVNVSKKTSEVLLILDQEGSVGAKVWENRDAPGVVEGRGVTSSMLSMIYLPHDVELEKGQTIITSGLGRIFPQGIRIGEVEEIKDDDSGLMKKAAIRPFVNFSRLDEVLVILKVKDTYMTEEPVESQEEVL